MREEFIKKQFEVNGVTVYDYGEEFIFFAKNENGEDVEHHLAKIKPFPVSKDYEEKDLNKVLEAAVSFPNLPLSKALKELDKKEKK